MLRSLRGAALQLRLYARSGKIIFPLLGLILFPSVFYHVAPVDAASSFAISSAAAFVWGAWLSMSYFWSADSTVRRILCVKTGRKKFRRAQNLLLMAAGALGGVFVAAWPLAKNAILPGMFVVNPTGGEAGLGVLLNLCAGVGGAAFGGVFQPTTIRDRKLASLLCLLTGLMGFVDGAAGAPVWVRAALPPLYDTMKRLTDALPAGLTLGLCAWMLGYAAVCLGIQAAVESRADL